MTLHAAKGLEFNTIFLPGWEEGLFPHQRSLDESGTAGLEEERRLAYVGVTRAKRRARISFAQNRRVHGLWQTAIPSRFVDELPEANVEVAEDSGNYGGYGAAPGASRFDRMSASGGGFGGSGGGFSNSYDTPGWQRAQKNWSRTDGAKRSSRGPQTIDGELVASSTGKSSRYGVGDRVRHNKFGAGSVTTVDGNKLVVEFDTAGPKKVVDSFIEKA